MGIMLTLILFIAVCGLAKDVVEIFKDMGKDKKNEPKGWLELKVLNETHVIPRGDKHTHMPSKLCGCSPKSLAEVSDEGEVSWKVTHVALDGRKAA